MMNALEREVKNICEEESENYDDGIRGFIKDLQEGGCSSGLVGSLIYYEDTVSFYNNFKNEIQELINDCVQEMGYDNQFDFILSLNGAKDIIGDSSIFKLQNNEQLKNLLAWFAFEETAFRMFGN